MDAAAKHENRYRAVIEYANGAMFNVAELDAWATSKKAPVSFETLLKDERIADNYSAEKHFIHFSILSVMLASRLVPEDMEPSDATTQLMAAGDDGSYADPVRRMRDLVMVRYERLLLSAVYDGELNLYDSLMFTKMDVNAARLGYTENPDAFLQSSHTRLAGDTQAGVTTAPSVAVLFVDPAITHVPVVEIAEMTSRAVHPSGGVVWAAALDAHRQQLDAAIHRGEIRGFVQPTMQPCRLTGLPVRGEPLANTGVPVEDVRKFAARVGVKVTFDFSEVKYEFVPEVREAIANESHWGERELEALCLGVPLFRYCDDCAPESERLQIRQAIVSACKNGKLDAQETGNGNAVYGGKWRIERVSAVRWAIANHFKRFPEWLAGADLAEISKRIDDERHAAGRYTLQEAAEALQENTGTAAEEWVIKLKEAVLNKELSVHRPGEEARYHPHDVKPFYAETYWDDLNRWLAQYDKRVKFRFPEPVTPATSAQCTALWARCEPARLYGEGFSEEMQRQTTLTRYLDFDTWTAAAAAMLVCGLQAPIENGQLCTEIPTGRVKGLDGLWKSEQNGTAIADAKRVLGIWRSQVSPPARVSPLDFVEWCQARGFDIAWLRSLQDDVLSKERRAMKAALGSGVVVVPSTNHFAVWLADHIAFSLVAIPNDERLTTVFKVTVVKREPGSTQTKRELLSSDEWHLVRSICGNPPVRCSRAQFEEWRGRFNAAGNKPDWSLDGDFCWSDETVKAQARWTDVSEAHRQQFEQMAKKGDLSLVTPDGMPTTDISNGRMSRDDFIRYLQSRGLRMQSAVAVSVAPAVVGAHTDVVMPAAAAPSTPETDRREQAIPIESLLTQPGFERNYQMLVTERGSSPVKSAITSALIASAKAGETLGASIRTIKKKGEKWSDAELRTLLDESKMPDFTQKAAGEKYGVKPQRISRLLQQAKDKFESSVKASKFPTANLSGRKVRGRNY